MYQTLSFNLCINQRQVLTQQLKLIFSAFSQVYNIYLWGTEEDQRPMYAFSNIINNNFMLKFIVINFFDGSSGKGQESKIVLDRQVLSNIGIRRYSSIALYQYWQNLSDMLMLCVQYFYLKNVLHCFLPFDSALMFFLFNLNIPALNHILAACLPDSIALPFIMSY